MVEDGSKPAADATKQQNLEDFVENGPLYSKVETEGGPFQFPKRLMRLCEKCEKETTWTLEDSSDFYLARSKAFRGSYQCAKCEQSGFGVIVFPAKWRSKIRTTSAGQETVYMPFEFAKIAQYPQHSIKISPTLTKTLADSADLYRKALVCWNQGYGIGALSYMRRIVEDKTNDFIKVVEDYAAAMGVGEDVIVKIRAAREQKTTFDQKIKIAAEAMPSALKPDGVNPMELLYGAVSDGMHGRSEDECLVIADEIRDVFEYVFGQLRAQVEEQKSFVSKVKKWAGGQKRWP